MIESEPAQPTTATFDSEVFLKWNQLFMEIDRNAFGYRPGPGPRALGYMGLSAYESVVAGMPENNSLQYHFYALSIHKPRPINIIGRLVSMNRMLI